MAPRPQRAPCRARPCAARFTAPQQTKSPSLTTKTRDTGPGGAPTLPPRIRWPDRRPRGGRPPLLLRVGGTSRRSASNMSLATARSASKWRTTRRLPRRPTAPPPAAGRWRAAPLAPRCPTPSARRCRSTRTRTCPRPLPTCAGPPRRLQSYPRHARQLRSDTRKRRKWRWISTTSRLLLRCSVPQQFLCAAPPRPPRCASNPRRLRRTKKWRSASRTRASLRRPRHISTTNRQPPRSCRRRIAHPLSHSCSSSAGRRSCPRPHSLSRRLRMRSVRRRTFRRRAPRFGLLLLQPLPLPRPHRSRTCPSLPAAVRTNPTRTTSARRAARLSLLRLPPTAQSPLARMSITKTTWRRPRSRRSPPQRRTNTNTSTSSSNRPNSRPTIFKRKGPNNPCMQHLRSIATAAEIVTPTLAVAVAAVVARPATNTAAAHRHGATTDTAPRTGAIAVGRPRLRRTRPTRVMSRAAAIPATGRAVEVAVARLHRAAGNMNMQPRRLRTPLRLHWHPALLRPPRHAQHGTSRALTRTAMVAATLTAGRPNLAPSRWPRRRSALAGGPAGAGGVVAVAGLVSAALRSGAEQFRPAAAVSAVGSCRRSLVHGSGRRRLRSCTATLAGADFCRPLRALPVPSADALLLRCCGGTVLPLSQPLCAHRRQPVRVRLSAEWCCDWGCCGWSWVCSGD